MSELSRDIALRIGLAARSLPEVAPAQLLQALIEQLGLPLTEEKLQGLKVKDLKLAMEELTQVEPGLLQVALRQLKEGEGVNENLPAVQPPLSQGQFVRVACASNQGELLDGHFGSCVRFLIYQVTATEMRLVEIRSTLEVETAVLMDDRNEARAQLIGDCHLLYVVSIGGPPAAKVVKQGIHPVKVAAAGEARVILAELQNTLASSPPPWLAKLMGRSLVRICHNEEDEE